MISFSPTEEQKLACAVAADLAARALSPNARAADEGQAFSTVVLDQIWRLGLVANIVESVEAPAEQHTLLNVQTLEHLATGDCVAAMALAGPLGFVKALAEQGSDRQKHEFLACYATESFQSACVAVADARRTPRTYARKTAFGYELNGVKALLPMAQSCAHFLVVADVQGRREVFIVSRNDAGVRVSERKGVLGLRALAMADVAFEGVVLPDHARLGEERGCDVGRIVDAARTALSAIMTGLSSAVYSYALPYTQQRIVHGEAIARKQSVAFKLADMHIEIDAMRWMTWRAADELDKRCSAQRSASLARRYCAARAMTIADEGVQLFGGHGFVRDLPLEMWCRNARAISVLEGLVGA